MHHQFTRSNVVCINVCNCKCPPLNFDIGPLPPLEQDSEINPASGSRSYLNAYIYQCTGFSTNSFFFFFPFCFSFYLLPPFLPFLTFCFVDFSFFPSFFIFFFLFIFFPFASFLLGMSDQPFECPATFGHERTYCTGTQKTYLELCYLIISTH